MVGTLLKSLVYNHSFIFSFHLNIYTLSALKIFKYTCKLEIIFTTNDARYFVELYLKTFFNIEHFLYIFWPHFLQHIILFCNKYYLHVFLLRTS